VNWIPINKIILILEKIPKFKYIRLAIVGIINELDDYIRSKHINGPSANWRVEIGQYCSRLSFTVPRYLHYSRKIKMQLNIGSIHQIPIIQVVSAIPGNNNNTITNSIINSGSMVPRRTHISIRDHIDHSTDNVD
jgi:hypothetical protein